MDQQSTFPVFPMYFRGLLLLAGMYTLAWSAFYKWFGGSLLAWLAMDMEAQLDLHSNWFGSFGLVVGLLIFISAFYPVSWIRLMLAGLIGKVIMAVWFVVFFLPELGWNKRTGFELIFNELFWLIPLGFILWRAKEVKDYLTKNG
ncbi:hypothetical protein [Algoriphagus sediminis]|uniref:DUF4345 domain-containing protein n=1 Tax=Algoriphagus sediminis TaxID=3057113 RepID=A0ABT7YCJ7_9BACT|nr:hypothetical protein [Algoriphagus sediminis]MDN3203909.1 hypothetical protein [Algoriphagus sediminis]